MNADTRKHSSLFSAFGVYLRRWAVLLFFVAGCAGPNKANIELRKENQALRDQVEQLERDRAADKSTIASLQQSKGALATLPQDRLDKLFTVHGVRIERLSGGAKLNADAKIDDALKIYVTPTDDAGQPLKASGSFVVEAFDLKNAESTHVGRWEFSTDQAKKSWLGEALLYEYVLPCPLEATPKHDELTVHVTFTDELTQRTFEAQHTVHVMIAPVTIVP